ncbi:hypothetical protein TRFO_19828 [Tritrichomonas foetus]|uniref:ADF-H domain-containing protein n=1 Tax=Tritrichomonas foetus TaxID=1144522 RepID=A0A1J4KM55_9EUKA|nr:hypothetical protein TRFO_19828 [Tritrichomonas foetus]|eukprot:OHT10774.1 hypothetical protein TRFO_19828 [Tritrichomonas foetus]
MSNTALIEIGESLTQALIDFKGDDTKRAVKLTIENEVLLPVQTIPVISTPEEDFDSLGDHLNPKEPSFLVTRLAKQVGTPEFLLIIYIPPTCPIRPRTIFASSRVPVQRHLSQVFAGLGDYFVDDIKDVNYKTYLQVTRKDTNAMSYDEIRATLDAQDQHVGQVQLPTHDSFTWPVADDLMALLKDFVAGSGPKIVAGQASPTGGAISHGGSGDSLSDIDSKSPKYCAIRYNNNGTELKVFLLLCPDNAKSREKMMSSTCKHSFLKGCEECGLTFDKSFEVRDERDFTDSYLDELVNPSNETHGYGEVKALQKPRRPGRR